MKKFLISFLLATMILPSVKAQDNLFDNSDNKSYFGVRLGLDIVSLQGDMYNNRAGFQLGAIYNMPIWKNLYFEPGISLFYNTAKANVFEWIPGPNNPRTLENWGLRIPFIFGYHFDFTDNLQIILYTGPQLDANISFHTKFNDNLGGTKADFNRFDFGWNFGIGARYDSYYLGLGGTVGINHLVRESIYYDGARRNLFTISLGYNF